MIIALVVVLTLGAGIISASFFEWTVHKYLLHRPVLFLKNFFVGHTQVHHMTYRFDHRYHHQPDGDEDVIHMKRWALVLIGFGSTPYLWVMYLFNFPYEWVMVVTGVVLSTLYYVAYEYLHFCMHLPKERRLEMSWWFRRLNGHHLLHHRLMGKNFNVVCPLADVLMGTLVVRSTVHFKQPRGPYLPDVQPLTL